jgi:hypothetical protein
MKSIFKSLAFLQMAAALTIGAFAANVHADGLPFHGEFESVETSVVTPPTFFVEGSSEGQATHLGRFTATYEVTVNLATRASVGSAILIAANGDSIFVESTGQGNPIAGTDFSFIVEKYVITGGTGRFAGASGSFTSERLLNRATGVSVGSFTGTIARE